MPASISGRGSVPGSTESAMTLRHARDRRWAAGPWPLNRPWLDRGITQAALPLLFGAFVIGLWHFSVELFAVPPDVLPSPAAVWQAFADDHRAFLISLWFTVKVTLQAFGIAFMIGTVLAVLFVQFRVVEMALLPLAILLQVTPIIAIAPMTVLWVGPEHPGRAILILGAIVAVLPILSNMTVGMRDVDPNLSKLFDLYGASRWARLWRLQIPSALPRLLSGLKMSGGLALVGTVVGAFVVREGPVASLSGTIIAGAETGQLDRLFVALILLALTGFGIFALLQGLQYLILHKWYTRHRRLLV